MRKQTKRFLSVLAAGVIALQSAAITPIFAGDETAANEIAMYKPVLDGTKDAAYDQSLSISLNKDTKRNGKLGFPLSGTLFSKYTGNADATAYYLWSDNYLYIYADVTDSTVDPLEADTVSANPTLNNNVFFTVWDGAEWPGASAEILANASNNYVYRVNTAGTIASNISDAYETATASTEYIVNVKAGVGYSVEMRVDLGELVEGDEWNLALSVNDWTAANFNYWRFGYMYSKDKGTAFDATVKLGGKLHVFSDAFTTDVQPDCTTEGSKSKHCLEEGCTEVSEVTVVAPRGHFEIDINAVEATCTSTGLTAGKFCPMCNTTTVPQQEVAMLDHTPVTDAAVDATCYSTGLTEGSHCDECEAVIVAQTETPVIDHNWIESIIVDATCTEAGSKQLVCDGGCDSVDPEIIEIPATGHSDEDADNACDACGESLGIPGDITGDGKVDVKDLTRLMKIIAGDETAVAAVNPDVTGDGKVDVKDLTRLMKAIAGDKVELH